MSNKGTFEHPYLGHTIGMEFREDEYRESHLGEILTKATDPNAKRQGDVCVELNDAKHQLAQEQQAHALTALSFAQLQAAVWTYCYSSSLSRWHGQRDLERLVPKESGTNDK